jgi:hypothetical protein
MKTAMQELIDRLDYLIGLSNETMYEFGLKFTKKEAESMLEKEKQQMCQFANAWDKELNDGVIRSVEDCFEATFNTNEK